MTGDQIPNRDLVRFRTGAPRGPRVVAAAAIVIAIVSVGLLGRLLPDRGSGPQAATIASPTPSAALQRGVRLVSPIAGVVWLRTTEITVRGEVPADVPSVHAVIRIDGQVLGEAVLDVDGAGRFDGVIQIVPPGQRRPAILDVHASGPNGRQLAEVTFSIEAGALLLVRHPTGMAGVAGATMVVDVLVYGPLHDVRGLLTSPGGTLIASASRRLGASDPDGGVMPRTVTLELEIPDGGALPSRARLHVLGLDQDGMEIEHIDSNVRLSGG